MYPTLGHAKHLICTYCTDCFLPLCLSLLTSVLSCTQHYRKWRGDGGGGKAVCQRRRQLCACCRLKQPLFLCCFFINLNTKHIKFYCMRLKLFPLLCLLFLLFRCFLGRSTDPRTHTHTHTYIAHICSQSSAIFTNPHVLYELPPNGGVLKGAWQAKCATKREKERERRRELKFTLSPRVL